MGYLNRSLPWLFLAYPLVDTLRIFGYRALQGRSPFSADKNHIHHKLVRLGLSHKKIAFIIYTYSIVMVLLTLIVPKESPNVSFLVVGGVAVLAPTILFMIKDPKQA